MNITLTTFRLFFHVLAATVWVGGQLVMGGIVPVARKEGGLELTRKLAQRFGIISWSAFFVLTFTGIWNAMALEPSMSTYPSAYLSKFGFKMTCYVITGFGAALHSLAPTIGKRYPKFRVPGLAIGGALGALGAIGTLFFAVSLKY